MVNVHYFLSSGEAYDASQCDENIRNGDVLVIKEEEVVGWLLDAWPVAITREHGEFHLPAVGKDPREFDNGKWVESISKAEQTAKELGYDIR